MNGDLSKSKREWALGALARYWPERADVIERLDIPITSFGESAEKPPAMQAVTLPEWASDLSQDGYLLVPSEAVLSGEGPVWKRVDWILAISWYLDGTAERSYERSNGPIHSYSFRLKGWDSRIWDRAWVNRIALFLRRWAARNNNASEEVLFGPLPDPEIVITHDLDAIHKTMAIRFKQAAYIVYNSLQHTFRGELKSALAKAWRATRFLVRNDSYDKIDQIAQMERQYNVRSHIYIYGGIGGWRRSPKMWLLDPAYSVLNVDLKNRLRRLGQDGWTLGLHQSYDAWANESVMKEEKERVEDELGCSVVSCRQHWLRFGWHDTWKTQEKIGLTCDMTLGFNDRSAFRNGAALRYTPWDHEHNCSMRIESIPLVVMDSHLYNTTTVSDEERDSRMSYWIDEIRDVRGVGSVVWHPHVLSADYGWSAGFENVLSMVAKL